MLRAALRGSLLLGKVLMLVTAMAESVLCAVAGVYVWCSSCGEDFAACIGSTALSCRYWSSSDFLALTVFLLQELDCCLWRYLVLVISCIASLMKSLLRNSTMTRSCRRCSIAWWGSPSAGGRMLSGCMCIHCSDVGTLVVPSVDSSDDMVAKKVAQGLAGSACVQ